MKKNLAIPLVCLLVAAGAGGGWWWSHNKAVATAETAAAPGGGGGRPAGGAPALVTTATAQRQDVPVTVQVNGSVVSLNSVDLRPQVQNTVRTVHVKEGQFVTAGQLLFTLDDRPDQANLAKAKAQQLRDEATLADLERQYKRSQDLVAQNFIAKSAADATLSQLDAQRAAVAADRASVQSAQVALGYASLRSPIAGRIGAISFYAGSLAQPTVPLVTVTQLDPIAVSFPVPEGYLQDLLQASRERLAVEAVVKGRKTPLRGTLSFVDNAVDPLVGTVRAKAVFANADQSLWPGQFVETRVTVRTLTGVTVVPAAALILQADGAMLYVIDAEKNAQRRKVQVLHTFDTQVAVRDVAPGEQVVVEGKQNVRPGGKVRIEAAAPKPGKAAPTPAGGSSAPAPGAAALSPEAAGTRTAPAPREPA